MPEDSIKEKRPLFPSFVIHFNAKKSPSPLFPDFFGPIGKMLRA